MYLRKKNITASSSRLLNRLQHAKVLRQVFCFHHDFLQINARIIILEIMSLLPHILEYSLFTKGVTVNKNIVSVACNWPPYKKPTRLSCLSPSIPTTACIYLLIIPLIWESFSTCCCRSLRSLSSSRFWYCSRILLVCCSCVRSLRSYSSSFLWDISRRSFRELISSSYSRTWGRDMEYGPPN